MGLVISAAAAWVNGRELRHDCAVLADGNAIAAILTREEGDALAADKDHEHLTCDLLLPGFINAHCHLEYTGMEGRLPRGAVAFGDWLQAIVEAKSEDSSHSPAVAVTDGAQRLLAGGCTTVLDCVSSAEIIPYYPDLPLRHFHLYEVLGLSEQRAEETFARAEHALASSVPSPFYLGAGLAPHAPYSVGAHLHERLYRHRLANPHTPMAWHLAETEDEKELLDAGTGSIAQFLQRQGMPLPPRSSLPELLPLTEIAFHGNHLPPEAWSHFAAPRALVHCPGTHHFFERPPFPMLDMLAAGVNVCLGTDSLASSDSLSMLEMLRLCGEFYPQLSGPQLLDLATRNPAKISALANQPRRLGIIAPGAAADIALLDSQSAHELSIREMLLAPSLSLKRTVVAGSVALKS